MSTEPGWQPYKTGRLIALILGAALALGLPPSVALAYTKEPCGATAAQEAGIGQLVPDDLAEAQWGVVQYLCADLTRDGDREMIVRMACCTGGSSGPVGIFRHDSYGNWLLAYSSTRASTRGVRLVGRRAIRIREVASYNGSQTSRFRNRLVTWDGRRFVTTIGKAYTYRPR